MTGLVRILVVSSVVMCIAPQTQARVSRADRAEARLAEPPQALRGRQRGHDAAHEASQRNVESTLDRALPGRPHAEARGRTLRRTNAPLVHKVRGGSPKRLPLSRDLHDPSSRGRGIEGA